MEIGIFAKTFKSASVASLFETIHQLGIPSIHYNMVCSGLSELPLVLPEEKIDEINLYARKNGLKLIGLSGTFNMIDLDRNQRKKGLQALNTLVSAAPAIGTNFISLCTGSRDKNKWKWHPDNASKHAWNDLLKTFEKAIAISDEKGIILGVEPETGNVIRNPKLARKLLDELQCERVKIILDPANLFDRAKDRQEIQDRVLEALDLLHGQIHHAHAKDRSLDGTVRPAGKGDVDFAFFIHELKRAGFDGPLVLHGLDEQDVAHSVDHLNLLV